MAITGSSSSVNHQYLLPDSLITHYISHNKCVYVHTCVCLYVLGVLRKGYRPLRVQRPVLRTEAGSWLTYKEVLVGPVEFSEASQVHSCLGHTCQMQVRVTGNDGCGLRWGQEKL